MEPPGPDRLDSWKGIAAYLGRTEKTARRWEQAEGLPVHRLAHGERGSVYAYRRELDAWRTARTITARAARSADPGPGDSPVVHPSGSRQTRYRLAAGAALACVLLFAIAALLWRNSSAPGESRLALIVLPFLTDAEDEDDRHLGVGVAEAIVGHLAAAPDLRMRPVPALGSSPHEDASNAIATRSGADFVASGRVRVREERLAITVSLVDVGTDSQVWGESFDTHDDELGRAQERIALAIREQALRHAYGGSVTPVTYQPSHPLSHDPEALRLYLRARAFGRNPGRAPLDSAIRYLGEAVRIDSGFTAAYEALAIAHIAVTFFGDMPSSATIEQAKAHAATVLSHGAESVRAEAEAILADMLQRRREGYYPAFAIAVVRMGLGEAEAALDWLEQAFDERLMGYYPPNVDLTWRPLRQHPRFQDLLRRLRLPAS